MTTYVLGAGASTDAGYPLASSMGGALLKWMEGRQMYEPTLSWMSDTFETPSNLELVLTHIEDLLEAGEPSRERTVASSHKQNITQALRELFLEIRETGGGSYQGFAREVVRPGDVVLSFNYADALDRQLRLAELWHLGDGYGFPVEGFETGSTVELLKLHGSMNWFAMLFGGMPSGTFDPTNTLGSRPVLFQRDTEYLGYGERCDPGVPQRPVAAMVPLILPTERKKFYFDTNFGREWESFWNGLWQRAFDALRRSDQVVICGYSMLAVDRRARQLLADAIPKTSQIQVCSGGDTERIVHELRALGFNAEAAKETFFGEWVQAQSRSSLA